MLNISEAKSKTVNTTRLNDQNLAGKKLEAVRVQ